MPLDAPNLDDRRFEDLVREARGRIPRYAPEWTNFNESDPGMTLVQLFAWLTDLTLYRLNRVPERNYIKFLELLGIELQPGNAAVAELTFTLSRTDIDHVIVRKGTQVAAPDGGDGQPVVFETGEALVALGATLNEVQSFDGFAYSVETAKNAAPGQFFHPFGPNARDGSALLLGFDSPLPFTTQQVSLTVRVRNPTRARDAASCDAGVEGTPLQAEIVWEYWNGRRFEPLNFDKDETRAFTRSGRILFRGPGADLKKSRIGRVTTADLYWIRARLERGFYERPPRLEAIVTNTVAAANAVTARHEVLGGSDGEPGQVFRLASSPVVPRDKPLEVRGADGNLVRIASLRLEIDEGQGFLAWQEVDDFFASGENDPHFRLIPDTGEIFFGDGVHGRIPLANETNPRGNIIAREYRFGGGKRGNIGAGTISEVQTSVDFLDRVTNRWPAAGGADRETVAAAKLRAPGQLKSKDRAVTAEDFQFLALATPGALVRRAHALPLHHPHFPDAQIPGVVSVIVVPESDAPNPMPSPATLALVCAWLNGKRLLTSEIYVIPPAYRKVAIRADVVVRADEDLGEVKRLLEDRLTRYFHPLFGGDSGAGWDFGQAIFNSEVYRVVLDTPGVARIHNNNLFVLLDDELQAFCRDVPIRPGELLFSTGHDLTVAYSFGRG